MSEGKGGKLHDIKETASDAVEIIETMKTPEWQRNMDNIRLISENFNQASKGMDNTMKELKETGIIDDAKELIKTAKEKLGSFGGGTKVAEVWVCRI